MTVDYQVVEFQSSSPVREVGLFSDAPLTLDVAGDNFRNIAEVRINGVRSQEFIVLSPRRLLAEVPRSQRGAAITSVAVIAADQTATRKSIITFVAAPSRGQRAEGRVRLVQTFLKLLFTTPGRDVYSPNLGGSLLSIVGKASSPTAYKAAGTLAVTTTQSQLIQIQAQDSRLADDERLKSASLLSSDFDPQTATLSLRIRLTSVDGSTTDASVIL